MSHQPSTIDNIRSTALSATQAAARGLNPSQDNAGIKSKIDTKVDEQGVPCEKGSFKDQLDEAAYAPVGKTPKDQSILGKVSSYIPGMGASKPSMSEQAPEKKENKEAGNALGGLKRSDHDLHVEQFLKSSTRVGARLTYRMWEMESRMSLREAFKRSLFGATFMRHESAPMMSSTGVSS